MINTARCAGARTCRSESVWGQALQEALDAMKVAAEPARTAERKAEAAVKPKATAKRKAKAKK